MKKILVAALILIALSVNAQTYKIVNGQIQTEQKTKKVKQPDRIYKIHDKKTFYIGPKGGVYYWETKKDGKKVKKYVKQAK